MRSKPELPPDQQAIWDKTYHPSGIWDGLQPEDTEQSIPDCFAKVMRRYPDRTAIKTRERGLTYRELNREANRVAHGILSRSGEGEGRVLLLFEHDIPAFVALLGALKAGKTYVGLDRGFPPARNRFIAQDAQAQCLVTNRRNMALARELSGGGLDLVDIDALGPELPGEDPVLSISPDVPCTIVYTSGSTGKPKGVVHSHRTMLHAALESALRKHICCEDRKPLPESYGTHAGLMGVFDVWLTGATLLPCDVKGRGLGEFAEWLRQQEVTVFSLPPTVYREFASYIKSQGPFPHVRLLYLGADRVEKRDVELYRELFSLGCVFLTGLCSSESGTEMRRLYIDKATPLEWTTVPVGYPTADMEVFLVDEAGNRVGDSTIGEIAVRSRYLALGYWGRPDLTRERFLPDPGGGDERIFLTGDMGLMLPDGCLFHKGRKDFQVKIGGSRVEIPEVEEALLALDSVKAAVVTARASAWGDQRLIAYLVPAGEARPTVSYLRRALLGSLPEYMIPSAFVMLDALPHTANGKVDRLALPPPGTGRPALDSPFVPPRTSLEVELVRIWAEVLELQAADGEFALGTADNFFELGGNSLLATQVVSRIRSALGVELPLRSLFEGPTVAGLAECIEGAAGVTVQAVRDQREEWDL